MKENEIDVANQRPESSKIKHLDLTVYYMVCNNRKKVRSDIDFYKSNKKSKGNIYEIWSKNTVQ